MSKIYINKENSISYIPHITIEKCTNSSKCEQNQTKLNDKILDLSYNLLVFDQKINFIDMSSNPVQPHSVLIEQKSFDLDKTSSNAIFLRENLVNLYDKWYSIVDRTSHQFKFYDISDTV